MNSAIYRKTMETFRNRVDLRLVNKEKDHLKCTSKQSCISHKIFDRNFVAIGKSKLALKLNKPAYIGMCILGLGKVSICEFHYDYIKKRYDKKPKLLFTDTDSFMYEIKS